MPIPANAVPCTGCDAPIPAARAAISFTEGKCASCLRPSLACAQEDTAPMYETDAWAKGIKL